MLKEIAASILNASNKLTAINELIAQDFTTVHYDVMDGQFVSHVSLPLAELHSLVKRSRAHTVDVHLMVNNPYAWVKSVASFADLVSFHVEASSPEVTNTIIRDFGAKTKIGLALNPGTPVTTIIPFLSSLSFVLIMSVEPGRGGQKFMYEVLHKVIAIRALAPQIMIAIDGGIDLETASQAFAHGINLAISGSFLIKNIHNHDVCSALRRLCTK